MTARSIPGRAQTDQAVLESSWWERGMTAVVTWAPYVTLFISTTFFLAKGNVPGRAGTLGLAAVAAIWVYLMYTRLNPETAVDPGGPGPTPSQRLQMVIYFAGILVLFFLLMARDPVFFIFVITGFFHAYLLSSWPLAFLGVFVTSVIINSQILQFPSPDADAIFTFVVVVFIQTLAIGFGTIGGQKLAELSEQRRRALTELEAAVAENDGLHAQLLTQAREAGVLDERQRMAREIHDTIAQGLTGVITQLEAAGNVKDPSELGRHLDNATRLARESLTEARRSVQGIVPVPLEMSHLPDAISDVAKQWSGISEVPVQLTTTGTVQGLHPEIEVVLLRVVQEALANVGKHARASRVGVTLSYMGDVVTLDVRDDGVGFVPPNGNGASARGGFGLTAMRQRVDRVAGQLEVESGPGEGTAISVSVPAVPADSGQD